MLAFETDATSRMKRSISSFTCGVRLHADVEVENHLGEARNLDLLQRGGDALRVAEQHRVLGDLLGLNPLQASTRRCRRRADRDLGGTRVLPTRAKLGPWAQGIALKKEGCKRLIGNSCPRLTRLQIYRPKADQLRGVRHRLGNASGVRQESRERYRSCQSPARPGVPQMRPTEMHTPVPSLGSVEEPGQPPRAARR
jgi:hypothetical protein